MEVLASPPMIPTSQHAGNTTADNSAAQTAPGVPSQSAPPDMVAPVPQLGQSGGKVPVGGMYTDAARPAGRWKYTPASGRS
jgi:hypothetical protein